MVAWDDERVREQVSRVEALLASFSGRREPVAAARAMEAVEALVALYGECLARMMSGVERSGNRELVGEFSTDELISHLLLVHDLHPDDVGTRVEAALDGVRQEFGVQVDAVELLGMSAGAIRVRVVAQGCGSTAERMRQAVRDAVAGSAPEIEQVEIEEGRSGAPVIPVDSLFSGGSVP